MKTMESAGGRSVPKPHHPDGGMTLARLRHEIRDHLNAIKLSCALLARDRHDPELRDIDRSADSINELITRFMGDADAPTLPRADRPTEL